MKPRTPTARSLWLSFACRGWLGVQNYRVYYLGRDGHIVRAEVLSALNDERAVKLASQMLNQHEAGSGDARRRARRRSPATPASG